MEEAAHNEGAPQKYRIASNWRTSKFVSEDEMVKTCMPRWDAQEENARATSKSQKRRLEKERKKKARKEALSARIEGNAIKLNEVRCLSRRQNQEIDKLKQQNMLLQRENSSLKFIIAQLRQDLTIARSNNYLIPELKRTT